MINAVLTSYLIFMTGNPAYWTFLIL